MKEYAFCLFDWQRCPVCWPSGWMLRRSSWQAGAHAAILRVANGVAATTMLYWTVLALRPHPPKLLATISRQQREDEGSLGLAARAGGCPYRAIRGTLMCSP